MLSSRSVVTATSGHLTDFNSHSQPCASESVSCDAFYPLRRKQASWKLPVLCDFNSCLMLNQPEVLAPLSPVSFSMSYPPDWNYQMYCTAVNSPWKWLGPLSSADVFRSSHHWPSPTPRRLSPSPPPTPPSFAPPRVWQWPRGLEGSLGVEQREEEGDVIEGWNHAIPQGAPNSPSPSLFAVPSRRSIRKTRSLEMNLWVWEGFPHCPDQCVGSAAPCFATDVASMRQSYSGLACAVAKPLGLLARHWR